MYSQWWRSYVSGVQQEILQSSQFESSYNATWERRGNSLNLIKILKRCVITVVFNPFLHAYIGGLNKWFYSEEIQDFSGKVVLKIVAEINILHISKYSHPVFTNWIVIFECFYFEEISVISCTLISPHVRVWVIIFDGRCHVEVTLTIYFLHHEPVLLSVSYLLLSVGLGWSACSHFPLNQAGNAICRECFPSLILFSVHALPCTQLS